MTRLVKFLAVYLDGGKRESSMVWVNVYSVQAVRAHDTDPALTVIETGEGMYLVLGRPEGVVANINAEALYGEVEVAKAVETALAELKKK